MTGSHLAVSHLLSFPQTSGLQKGNPFSNPFWSPIILPKTTLNGNRWKWAISCFLLQTPQNSRNNDRSSLKKPSLKKENDRTPWLQLPKTAFTIYSMEAAPSEAALLNVTGLCPPWLVSRFSLCFSIGRFLPYCSTFCLRSFKYIVYFPCFPCLTFQFLLVLSNTTLPPSIAVVTIHYFSPCCLLLYTICFPFLWYVSY